MAAHCRPGITTLHVPSFAIGERAAEVLLAGGQDVPGTAPRHVFMELELIVRGSTMPPGTAGKAAASVQRAVSA
jgi:LacI family transcriptional regulator